MPSLGIWDFASYISLSMAAAGSTKNGSSTSLKNDYASGNGGVFHGTVLPFFAVIIVAAPLLVFSQIALAPSQRLDCPVP